MTGSFHEQVSVVSHEAFYLLNGGTLQPRGGWIPSSGAGEQGQLQPVPCLMPALPGARSRFLRGTILRDLHPSSLPSSGGSKSLRSASPSTGKSQTDSQLVCYSCLDYSLQAGWEDLMDLIRGSWLCATSLLLFGVPLQPSTGRSVHGGAGMVLGWGPGTLRSF